MSADKRSQRDARASRSITELCGDPQPDDGVDPRTFFQRGSRKKSDRKARQLCGQIAQTLNYVLSGECNDDDLRNLIVMEVVPAPDASRLLVTVGSCCTDEPLDPAITLQKLQAVNGKLRREIAVAIHRKRTPELLFQVLQTSPGAGDRS